MRDAQENPEDLFRELQDDDVPPVDSEALWRRIEARMPAGHSSSPPVRSWRFRPLVPWLGAAAAAIVIAIVMPAPQSTITTPASTDEAGQQVIAGDSGARELVLLEPRAAESPLAIAPAREPVSWQLEVRLIEGFAGDADPLVNGAGGADALGDLRAQLGALLDPFVSFRMLGSWRGDASERGSVALGDGYRLDFRAEPGVQGLRLSDVVLHGEQTSGFSRQLELEPGRTYLFGVRTASDDSPAPLVVAVQLRLRDAAPLVDPTRQ